MRALEKWKEDVRVINARSTVLPRRMESLVRFGGIISISVSCAPTRPNEPMRRFVCFKQPRNAVFDNQYAPTAT